jgi:probable rRNA maturation factor
MKIRLQFERGSFPFDKQRVIRAVEEVGRKYSLTGEVEVGVSLLTDAEMTRLNRQYMGKRGTTDVLSFPLEKEVGPDGVMRLGDIAISFPQAEKQAEEKGISVNEEIEFLIRHGMLHLLGIHHD